MVIRRVTKIWTILIPLIFSFIVSFALAVVLRGGESLAAGNLNNLGYSFGIIFCFWLLVFYSFDFFEIQNYRRQSWVLSNLIAVSTVNTFLAIVYFYLQPELTFTPRRFLLTIVVITFVILLFWFEVLRRMLRDKFVEEVYFIGSTEESLEIEKALKQNLFLGMKFMGNLSEREVLDNQNLEGTTLVVAGSEELSKEVIRKLYFLRTKNIKLYVFTQFYEALVRRVPVSSVSELWLLENVDYSKKIFSDSVKRITDVFFGLIGLVVFVITYPIIAILIKISSKGPVLFVQSRVGKYGKIFRIYKYRTMKVGKGNTWTDKNDPRVTFVGRILRKFRLDELPQAINIFIGNMSLIGPRPEQVHIVEELKKQIPFYEERHLVKPGLSGWAQLNIYAASVEESRLKLAYDVYYIKHRSLLFDMEIILKTIYHLISGNGR